MELRVKLLQLLPLQTGTGKNGEWRKQEFIVETIGSNYPKKICISAWGDKINTDVLKEGNELNISFDVESREFNNRWYTDVKAWKIELASGASAPSSAQSQPEPAFEAAPPAGAEDDLPF